VGEASLLWVARGCKNHEINDFDLTKPGIYDPDDLWSKPC
jgi:hypothetical protein